MMVTFEETFELDVSVQYKSFASKATLELSHFSPFGSWCAVRIAVFFFTGITERKEFKGIALAR